MEPASILELTSTVLEMSRKLYRIFKAFRDAPKEIREYLAVLEAARKNDILLRQKLELVSSEVHQVSRTHEAEAADRQKFLLELQKYVMQLQKGTGLYLQLAQEANVRSDARLCDLADSLATDSPVSVAAIPTQENRVGSDHGSVSRDYEEIQPNDDFPIVNEQPETRQYSLAPQEVRRSPNHELHSVGQALRPACRSPTESLGCRTVMQKAFTCFQEDFCKNEKGFMRDFMGGGAHNWEDVQTQLLQKPHPLSQKISGITSRLVGASSSVEAFVGSSPQVTSIVWGSVRMMLRAATDNTQAIVADGLAEMSEAIMSCEREIALYKDPKIYSLVERLYTELLEVLYVCYKHYTSSGTKRIIRSNLQSFNTDFERPMAEVRRLSQAVLREVDYQHCLEIRDTSSRVAEIQIEQRRILATLEDQKRILRSLQEERQIMGIVQEQQKILQIVQQIQGAMQTRATGELTRS